MHDDVRRQIMTSLTVPIRVAGKALGMGSTSAYAAARRGDIPTIRVGRKRPVPTAVLRKMLSLDGEAA